MTARTLRMDCLARLLPAVVCALMALPCHALQPGLLPKQDTSSAPPPGVASPDTAPRDDAAEKVRAQLASAQAELDRVVASPMQALAPPPGTPESQLVTRQALLRQIVRSYQQQLDEMAALNKLQKEQGTSRELTRWHMDETRAKFSMLEAEALRTEVQSKLRQIDTLTINLSAIDSQLNFSLEAAKRTDEMARQLLEQIEKGHGQVDRLIWERDFQVQRGRQAAASIDAFKTRRKLREAELSQARSELEYLEEQLKKTEGKLEFSQADRDTLLEELDKRLKALDKELETALAETEKARKKLAEAESRLATARAGSEATTTGQRFPRQDQLEKAVELDNLRLSTANARVNASRMMLSSVDIQRSTWSLWYDIVRTRDSETERQLEKSLKRLRDTVTRIHLAADASFSYTLQQLADVEREILGKPEAEDVAFQRMKASILRERTEFQARLLGELMSADDLLDRWKTRFVSEAGRATDDLSLDEWKRQLRTIASDIWSFELFSAADTIEVEGRKFTAERSITLGKVVSALLILLIGLLLGRLLINASCRFSVRYLKTAENETMLAGKWFFALLFVILFMLSLMTVKIPFTVFAFLGGAVAIGIGFGMQALFKNLISGVMVLLERPFRLGDIVEVGNIRGKVVDINLRSSIIRNRDDIETLVPNSTFIEQQVTNWTYSTKRVRYTLNVGVAYGSPPKVVRELLLETAKRHKLVLQNPEPEVFFEDFGPDALVFSLQYWLELTAAVDLRRVASDLRFMLDKAFADAGVVIAFPQRDVHLDVGQPVPVRIVSPP